MNATSRSRPAMRARVLARAPAVAAVFALGATPQPAFSAEPQLPPDGWVSWEVPAPEGAPFWCCWNHWKQGGAAEPCKLDARSNGFGSRGDNDTTDAVKIYVRTTAGKIDRIQSLAASCPVETKAPINPLAGMSTDDSVRWIAAQAKREGRDAITGEPLAQMSLAALSMHRGDAANRELESFARGDARADVRQWAVFWVAHAGRANAEDIVTRAARTDADGGVREHAVFALSLLPEDRAVKSLIALAEDRSLSREQRKRAVFWLSQSERDSAQAYLDKVLAGARR